MAGQNIVTKGIVDDRNTLWRVPRKSTVFCHCEYCQKRTGSTEKLLVYFRRDAAKKFAGPLKKFRHISDQSGRWIDTEFCEKCGSAVTWTLNGRY